jgi:hypothetical protein
MNFSRNAMDRTAATWIGPLRRALRVAALACLLAAAACGPTDTPPAAQVSAGEWHEFQGTWTATGSRHRIPLGPDRGASIADFEGSLLLTGTSSPAVGFRAEAIVLNDSATGMVGRAVWIDDHGYEVYSEMRGEGSSTANRVIGTFLGGTGPYAGATGTYEFTWKFMIENESGAVQGQSVGFKGRVRVGSATAAAPAGGPPR